MDGTSESARPTETSGWRLRLEWGLPRVFVIGEKKGRSKGVFRLVESTLFVPTVEDGERLRAVFADAMPMKKKRSRKPSEVKPPTRFPAIDLSGPGTQQRRKWATGDGALEMLVEWNTKSKQGVFLEKGEHYRPAVHALIDGLVS